MNIVSSGEIVKGMFVIAYECKTKQTVFNPITGEVNEIEKTDNFPWFKGIPYEVLGKAGPIISVKTFGLQNLPPVIFFDTRFSSFFETNKEFYDSYYQSMGVRLDSVKMEVPQIPHQHGITIAVATSK